MKQSRDLLNEAVLFCERKKWIHKTDIVLLALSGGADSVFLFYVLLELRKSVPFDLHAIHINHLLRGKESDGDETFVAELTKTHHVKSSIYKVDVKQISKNTKKSIEMAARDARYDLIFKETRKIGATVIALAHNADDRVETALMRFISGSSVVGISGLKAVREYKNVKIVRPIIEFFKADILEYLKDRNIPFRFDSSNNNEIFLRNKIRNRLIPIIQKDFNPNFKNNLLNTVDLFEQQADYLRCVADKSSKEALIRNDKIVVFDKTKLIYLHKCIISRLLLNSLYSLAGTNIRLASYHINNLVDQIELTSKRTYLFPGNIIAVADRRYLIIMNRDLYSEFIKKQNVFKKIEPDKKKFFELSCGLSMDISISKILEKYNDNNCFDDKNWDSLLAGKEVAFSFAIPYREELLLRFRKEGDVICFNYGCKKLKKYFIDTHIPFILRNILPVVSDRKKILWAPKMRIKDLSDKIFSGRKYLNIQIKIKLDERFSFCEKNK